MFVCFWKIIFRNKINLFKATHFMTRVIFELVKINYAMPN